MDGIFFGDGEGGPYIPEFDPDWFREEHKERRKADRQMAEGLDERDLKEEVLDRKQKQRTKSREVKKVPLSSRHGESEVRGKPFERWVHDVVRGRKKISDPLDFTKEELEKKLNSEL